MDKHTQIKKAETFLALHHDPKLLVLPNIWDPLGARMLQSLGYPAVATASAAVAFSLGYDDGEKITFDKMLDVIRSIAGSVDVPLTADIERGYSQSLDGLAENTRLVLEAGAVGINLEDSFEEGGDLRSVDDQCARIMVVRKAANSAGIPLVINARTDVFMRQATVAAEEKLWETVARGKAYIDAGADCIYPIVAGDIETLKVIREETKAPINVYARKGAASMAELEEIGISRLSLGPGLLKTSLTAMKKVAEGLKSIGSYELFTENIIDSVEIQQFVSKEKMRVE